MVYHTYGTKELAKVSIFHNIDYRTIKFYSQSVNFNYLTSIFNLEVARLFTIIQNFF